MAYECTVEDNIVIFRFANGKVNAINQETLEGLGQAVDRVNKEEELKGLVLIGAGRYFSGGFDLGTFTSFKSAEEILEWFKLEEDVLYRLFTCSKPVIAAINGHATAAGMIVSMACDYRLALNNPKIKVGMTEIKIGLALTPAEAEIMRFGLDTDKKYRDIIFGGELIGTAAAVERGIFDELVDDEGDLLARAKAKVCAFIDTPGRPFINLKLIQKRHAADWIQQGLREYDWNELVKTFTNESVVQTLAMMKQAIGA